MSLKERFLLFIKGLFMGLADIVPGVSGGTMALITGIYERFIEAIESINPLDEKKIDLEFLIPVGLGVFMAFFVASYGITFLLQNYESSVYAFFFGLIFSSSFVLYKNKAEVNWRGLVLAAAGVLISYAVASLEYFQFGHTSPIIFATGFLAICAMMLPGISGSLVVLMLGQYEYMLGSLKNLVVEDIGLFVLGGVFSLLGFSRVINYFLKNHKEDTLSFMIGLMLGALAVPVERIVPGPAPLSNLKIVLSGFLGLFIVLYMYVNLGEGIVSVNN